MRIDWNIARALAIAALAAGCSTAASEDVASACPGGGSELDVEGYGLCAYPSAIIETGFRCPTTHAHTYFAESGVICSTDALPDGVLQQALLQAFGATGGGGEGGSAGSGAGGAGGAGGSAGAGGSGGSCSTETLAGSRAIDVLFVVDNSGSMSPVQGALATSAPDLLAPLLAADVDFHLGVTTTGMTPKGACPGGANGGEAGRLFPVDGSAPRILDAATADLAQAFANNVNVGNCHMEEEGLTAAILATGTLAGQQDDPSTPQAGDGNLGFLRPEANLAVVFVSDEEDQSRCAMPGCAQQLDGNKPGRVRAHAIVGLPASCVPSAGQRYLDVVATLGGTSASICDPMGPTMAALGAQLAADAAPTVWRFAGAPADANGDGTIDEQDLVVTVDGTPVDAQAAGGGTNWVYDAARNAVVFHGLVPAAGAAVEAGWCN